MEWLNFKLMVTFGRKQAPVLRLAACSPPSESLFLIQGEIPNRKAQPVVHEWFAVRFEGQRKTGVLSLHDFLETNAAITRSFPNAGEFDIPVAITSLLPEAVAEARRYMSARREAFKKSADPAAGGNAESRGPGGPPAFIPRMRVSGRSDPDRRRAAARSWNVSDTSTQSSPITGVGWRIP